MKNSSLSPDENFNPIKVKVSLVDERKESFWKTLIILSGETFSGEIFVTFQKICHFRLTKFRLIRYCDSYRSCSMSLYIGENEKWHNFLRNSYFSTKSQSGHILNFCYKRLQSTTSLHHLAKKLKASSIFLL